jgi:hypothetical protein
MSKKRYVNTVFWDDAYITNLDPSEKLIFIYLLTNPCTNIAGVYQIPLKRIALDTGIDRDMCSKIIDRFQSDGKILYIDGWIAIKNFIKHQNFNSPMVKSGIERELTDSPDSLKTFIGYHINGEIYGIDTILNSDISKGISQGKGQSQSNRSVFKPPTPDEVQEYLDSQKCKFFDGEQFCDFYTARGWLIGKNKMKDWKAAVRTWIRRDKEKLRAELRCFDD